MGHRFELQGDDTFGAAKPNIEFVTQPFEIDAGGLRDLKQAMSEIRAIMSRLSKFVGDEDEQLANGTFVDVGRHRLSNPDALLVGGHATGEFKMQATQGVALEDLPTLMETFGSEVPGETRAQAKGRKAVRKLAYGDATGGAVSKLIGAAPSLARHAVAHIEQNRLPYGLSMPEQTFFEGDQRRLVGFLSQVLLYVKGLTIPDGKYMKYKVPMLGRTQLGTVFGELAPQQRTALSRGNAQALIGAVVDAANQRAVLPKPAHIGGFWDTGFTAASPLLPHASVRIDDPAAPGGRRTVKLMQSLTISDWLIGITQGTDRLSPAAMDTWLQGAEPLLTAPERTERTDLLESFNTLGTTMDPAERPGTSRLDILENRAIGPRRGPNTSGMMTPKQMQTAAIQYFQFLLRLKNGDAI